ncbi:MAG: hypothetical protein CMI26_10725 [Opitutae bacterium]|nr:hypothetical protein [Opitutae bacterium]
MFLPTFPTYTVKVPVEKNSSVVVAWWCLRLIQTLSLKIGWSGMPFALHQAECSLNAFSNLLALSFSGFQVLWKGLQQLGELQRRTLEEVPGRTK